MRRAARADDIDNSGKESAMANQVVDEHIDGSELLAHRFEHRLRLPFRRQIASDADRDGSPRASAQITERALDLCGVARHHGHPRPALDEQPRDLQAQAAPASGYDRGFSAQVVAP